MNSSEIITGMLWIGSAPTRNDLGELKEKIGPGTVVLDLTCSQEEKEWCRTLGVAYDERVPHIEESYQPIPFGKLKLVARIIDEHLSAGRKVFLHCVAGLGRSPTCAAAYLIHGGMSLSEAKRFVSEKRTVWTGSDANYAGSLDEFAKMQELARSA